MIVEFLWKEFLEDYDFFKIEYDNVDFDNITSIYCKLEGLYPNSLSVLSTKWLRIHNLANHPNTAYSYLLHPRRRNSQWHCCRNV